MKCQCWLFVVAVLALGQSLEAQRARYRENDDVAQTQLLRTVGSLRGELRDARRLIDRVNDQRLRQQLQVFCTRAERRIDELQELLGQPRGRRRLSPMTEPDFRSLLESLREQSFDEDKLRLIENFAPELRLTSQQVGRLMKSLSFDEGRMKAAIALYPSVVDPERYHETLRILPFEESRRKVMEAVKRNRRP